MNTPETLDVARLLIQRHGLRAQAVASTHVAEQRQHGDAAAQDRWEQIYAAVCELRRTVPARQTVS